jgi:hypothetical protein
VSNIYFCINKVFDALDNACDKSLHDNVVVTVFREKPQEIDYSEDLFFIGDSDRFIDLTAGNAQTQLTDLIEAVSLYHVNLELIIDYILSDGDVDEGVLKGIKSSFPGGDLPSKVKIIDNEGLRHPSIGYMAKADLCKIYLDFLKNEHIDRSKYSFEKNILGKHIEPLLNKFDGFISFANSMVRANFLIDCGIRIDHEGVVDRQVGGYVDMGRKKASEVDVGDTNILLQSWLEADHYQMRRCMDIDRFFNITDNPQKVPEWARLDTLKLIEKEAMKQFFAEHLVSCESEITATTPLIKGAIEKGAGKEVDGFLQKLVSEVLSTKSVYSGSAGNFAEVARRRREEAGLIVS